jgi:dihydrolipoamide dehydrogenase
MATKNFVLINGGAYGTTCARVGCMPSKVLIQVAEDFHHRHTFSTAGIQGGELLKIDIPTVMRHVRKLRDGFVGKVIKNKIEHLNDKRIDGYAGFVEPDVLKVGQEYIRAKKIIIATGSRPFRVHGKHSDNIF